MRKIEFLKGLVYWLTGPFLLFVGLLLICGSIADIVDRVRPQRHANGPIRILDLRLEPEVVVVGQPAVLFDGICNDSDMELSAGLYLGMQRVSSNVIQTETVDLLRHRETGLAVTDDEAGRLKRAILPGCSFEEPIEVAAVPELPDGVWRLRLRLVVDLPDGTKQDLTKTSPRFEVRH